VASAGPYENLNLAWDR